MPRRRLLPLALAAALLLAGCTAGGGPLGAPAEPTTTPRAVDALPSPSRCLTDAVPRPDPVDGVEPSAYPEPPSPVTRDALANWTQSFETAVFRNAMLADADDPELRLDRVSAYAELRSVNHTGRGSVIRFVDSGASNYAAGVHGDRWADVGYVVAEDRVVRVPLDGPDAPVRASEGAAVLDCG